MAKFQPPLPTIVLLWNRHLNESPVTQPFAKNLQTALTTRGYFVTVEKRSPGFPFSEDSWSGHVYPENTIVIELHTTPVSEYRHEINSKVKKWQARAHFFFSHGNVNPTDISLDAIDNHHFYLEIPGRYQIAHKNLLRRKHERVPADYTCYFEGQASLKASNAANFLSETVVRKAAHLIDETIKRVLGLRRPSRTLAHRYRKENLPKEPISAGSEVWRTGAKNARRNRLRLLQRNLH
jgi:hypothetical protein